MKFNFPKPKLPGVLLSPMEEITTKNKYDPNRGGQYVPEDSSKSKIFQGVIMPLSNEDLEYSPAGTSTKNAQKLYTNGHSLVVGTEVSYRYDGQTYTVKQELTHGPIHPMKRYVVERKGVSGQK